MLSLGAAELMGAEVGVESVGEVVEPVGAKDAQCIEEILSAACGAAMVRWGVA